MSGVQCRGHESTSHESEHRRGGRMNDPDGPFGVNKQVFDLVSSRGLLVVVGVFLYGASLFITGGGPQWLRDLVYRIWASAFGPGTSMLLHVIGAVLLIITAVAVNQAMSNLLKFTRGKHDRFAQGLPL